ncbi:MAG: acetyltransferase [Mobilitalea sp.]
MEHFSGTNNTLTTKNKKDKLLILGAGGHGKVIADSALKMNCWKEIAFLEDNPAKAEGFPYVILAKFEDFEQFLGEYDMIAGIGANRKREEIQLKLEAAGASIATILHPNVILGGNVTIGEGSVVMAGVIINTDTKIGKGCILNTAATIDHENNIEDFVHLSPGVHTAGNVKVGTLTWLGIGSSVIQNITIEKDCMIGAGAVVVNNLQVTGIYLGVPAKLIIKD